MFINKRKNVCFLLFVIDLYLVSNYDEGVNNNYENNKIVHEEFNRIGECQHAYKAAKEERRRGPFSQGNAQYSL